MASPFTNQTNSIDARMFAGNADSPQGTLTVIGVGDTGGVYRSVIKWDLSSIPANAVVTSATLSIYTVEDYSDNTRTMRAYRVLRAWVESEVTWNSYSTGNAWATAGCGNTTSDREATDIGSVSVASNLAGGSEVSISLTPSRVQEWISGALANNGILLKIDTESNDFYNYGSHENGTAGIRPKLVIEYTLGGGAFFALL
jgi:hypothetical protein